MNKTNKKLVIAGVTIDLASLKMRMDSLESLTNDKSNGLYGFIVNRKEVQMLCGLDLIKATDERQLERIRQVFFTGTDSGLEPEMRLPAATLLTSHRHLAKALRMQKKDTTINTLPMPIGIGAIGTCVTCAASPRKNLIARYHDFRRGGGVSSDPNYDQLQDADPFMDLGALTLLVPVLHYAEVKGSDNNQVEIRPRVSCVCASCLDYAMANTQSYMKKIELMSAAVPGKVDQISTHSRIRNKDLRKPKASGNNDNHKIGVKKLIRYAQSEPTLSNIVKSVKHTKKHVGKPDQVWYTPELAVAYGIALQYCTLAAQRNGHSLDEAIEAANRKDNSSSDGEEE